MPARKNTGRRKGASALAEARRKAVPSPRFGETWNRHRATLQALYPWDRLDDESDAAWELFRTWRDQLPGTRPTISGHAEKSLSPRTGRPRDKRTVLALAVRHRWAERAREWDRYVDRQVQEQTITARRRLAVQSGAVGDAALAVLSVELRSMLVQVQKYAELGRGSMMSPLDLQRLAAAFVPLAYRARDLPEVRMADPDVSGADGPVHAGDGNVDGVVSIVGQATYLMQSPDVRAAVTAWMAGESDRRAGTVIDTVEALPVAFGDDALDLVEVDDNVDLVDGNDADESMDTAT